MRGTIKDDRPNSKTVLKGRLTADDLAPFASDAAAAFAALQAQGVLNSHGRITDLLCQEDFALGTPAGVTDAAGLEAFLRSRRPATIQVRESCGWAVVVLLLCALRLTLTNQSPD